jgi:hypothetical protein
MCDTLKISITSQALAAYIYNPSYSGSRDQEDHGSKPAQANNSWDPILEKPFTKTGMMEWLKVQGLRSNSSTEKKKKKA